METFDEIMNSGDHAPNVIPGDLNSNLIRMLNREEIDAGGPMPPTKALKPEIIEIFTRWVLGGAPQTAEEAAAASGPITTTLTAPTTPLTVTLTAPEVTASPSP